MRLLTAGGIFIVQMNVEVKVEAEKYYLNVLIPNVIKFFTALRVNLKNLVVLTVPNPVLLL